jgi:hypothetical protein
MMEGVTVRITDLQKQLAAERARAEKAEVALAKMAKDREKTVAALKAMWKTLEKPGPQATCYTCLDAAYSDCLAAFGVMGDRIEKIPSYAVCRVCLENAHARALTQLGLTHHGDPRSAAKVRP